MEKIFEYSNATVRVTIPERTPEEQARFEKRLRKATEEFARAVLEAKNGNFGGANDEKKAG